MKTKLGIFAAIVCLPLLAWGRTDVFDVQVSIDDDATNLVAIGTNLNEVVSNLYLGVTGVVDSVVSTNYYPYDSNPSNYLISASIDATTNEWYGFNLSWTPTLDIGTGGVGPDNLNVVDATNGDLWTIKNTGGGLLGSGDAALGSSWTDATGVWFPDQAGDYFVQIAAHIRETDDDVTQPARWSVGYGLDTGTGYGYSGTRGGHITIPASGHDNRAVISASFIQSMDGVDDSIIFHLEVWEEAEVDMAYVVLYHYQVRAFRIGAY